MPRHDLRLTEIFLSIQGESRTAGIPTVFIRLTGCPLRCTYCDTAYAFHGGQVRDMVSVLDDVKGYGVSHVTVTGGEPLAQPACRDLLHELCKAGFTVSLETSGALPIEGIDPRVSLVMDLKTPTSGEMQKNLYSNIPILKKTDQVKFVIGDRKDYDWAKLMCAEHGLVDRVDEILFSPCHGELSATQLADWIIEDRLPVRLQMQLHKLLWDDARGK